ncbi:MAG: hypothetical protein NW206_19940 [Hyphomonadaceae bacterium]|nr:hypothetical protein [Hyphomonadaceae bacterium]
MSAAHNPTDATRAVVQALSQWGIPQEQIAAHIGTSAPTLRKHYGPQIDAGKLAANRKVAENLFKIASGEKGTTKEQVTAGIFWAKTQMGWREQVDVNHSGAVDFDGASARLLAGVSRALAAINPALSAAPGSVAPAAIERPN